MKKTLFSAVALTMLGAGAASAADLPYTKAPMPAPVAVVNWTGCYVGLSIGAKSARNSTNYGANVLGEVPGTPSNANFDYSGGVAGGTLGCNYQAGNFVFGLEGDANITAGSESAIETAFPAFRVSAEERWFATYRARIGYTVTPNWLVYITGGGASSSVRFSNYSSPTNSITQTNTLNGWTVGGGLEYAVNSNWSIKAEGLYIDYSRSSYFTPAAPVAGAIFDLRVTEIVGRVGFNYRFGPGLVAARY